MEFSQVIRRRRMVRRYLSNPVDGEVLERIFRLTQRAPSAGGTGGQHLVVITEPDLINQVAAAAGEQRYVELGHRPWISSAPVLVVVCTSEQAYHERYRQPDKAGSNTGDWPIPYWFVDAGATLMILLLAAVDEGLGAGLLGAHAFEGLSELLGLPPEMIPIGVVTIGTPVGENPSRPHSRIRQTFEEFVHRDGW